MQSRNRNILLFLLFTSAALLIFIPSLFLEDQDNGIPGSRDLQSPETAELTGDHEPDLISGINIDEISLNDLLQPMEELGPVNSILISQNGDLVAEQYFRGMHENRVNNIKSASKSILSLLVGIAIEEGYLQGIDQKIEEFFPEYFRENPDSVKASITVENLLTMRAGLQSTSGRNYGRWVTSNNWSRYVLDRPLISDPGDQRIYSTGTTHLLSVVLARASEMNTREFANHYLFGPMGIPLPGWDRDPQGYYLGGNNMALRPVDMIKIGQMMMNMGVYNGEQLVPSNWIINSIQPVTGRRDNIDDYGYLWFRRMLGDKHVIFAWGNGGQYIKIIPELDTVIAITSQNLNSGNTRNYRRELMSTLDHVIVPYLSATYNN